MRQSTKEQLMGRASVLLFGAERREAAAVLAFEDEQAGRMPAMPGGSTMRRGGAGTGI